VEDHTGLKNGLIGRISLNRLVDLIGSNGLVGYNIGTNSLTGLIRRLRAANGGHGHMSMMFEGGQAPFFVRCVVVTNVTSPQ
jgi:hypothetical protein